AILPAPHRHAAALLPPSRTRRPRTLPHLPYTTLFRSPDMREAVLGAPMPANDLRQDYVRAAIRDDAGALMATPFGVQDSSMLRRSEEHTSELQSRENLVCRLLLEKKNNSRMTLPLTDT